MIEQLWLHPPLAFVRLGPSPVPCDARGTPAADLREHCTARLATAFREHLRGCAALYAEAFPGPAWQDEVDAARAAGAVSPR